MIIVGIDDTDTLDSPGTNQLAKAIVRAARDDWRCVRIVRHQLFADPRVPYTSRNGSASITLEARRPSAVPQLRQLCEQQMLDFFVTGSDPGLCFVDLTAGEAVPQSLVEFGRLCQRAVVTQTMARALAAAEGIFLKGLGGTQDGVIGALAAVGLSVTGDDGRVVQHAEWPDDLAGPVPVPAVLQRGIELLDVDREVPVNAGVVDVGKHLRPNRRAGRTVLLVRACCGAGANFRALKYT